MGWAGLSNGELLREEEPAGFEAMVTGDKNLAYQQNLEGRKLALVVLGTTRWSILKRSPATLSDIAEASKLCPRRKPAGPPGDLARNPEQ